MKNNHKAESFWSGFSAGTLLGGLVLYAFASKNGRAHVKKLLAHAERYEDNLEGIIHAIQNIAKSNEVKPSKSQKKK